MVKEVLHPLNKINTCGLRMEGSAGVGIVYQTKRYYTTCVTTAGDTVTQPKQSTEKIVSNVSSTKEYLTGQLHHPLRPPHKMMVLDMNKVNSM